jgi:hypothetical protein
MNPTSRKPPPHGPGPVPPAQQEEEDDGLAQLREVEQELEEAERGEVPDPPARAGVRSGLLTLAMIVIFAGILAGLGVLCGKSAWVGAIFGAFAGACFSVTMNNVGLVPGGSKTHHAGYDGVAMIAVIGLLFLAAGLLSTTGLLI